MRYIKSYSYIINEKLSNTQLAYHGSKHDFESFSIHNFGSGEGASGFGYGMYFSTDKEDALEYARKLKTEKGEARLYTCEIPTDEYFINLDIRLDEQNDNIQQRLSKIHFDIKEKCVKYVDYPRYKKYIENLNNNISNNEYNFTIDSDEYKEFINEYINDEFMNIGIGFLSILESITSEYEASEILSNVGIKGNMHTSFRIKHYIIFDESDISIIKKIKPRFK